MLQPSCGRRENPIGSPIRDTRDIFNTHDHTPARYPDNNNETSNFYCRLKKKKKRNSNLGQVRVAVIFRPKAASRDTVKRKPNDIDECRNTQARLRRSKTHRSYDIYKRTWNDGEALGRDGIPVRLTVYCCNFTRRHRVVRLFLLSVARRRVTAFNTEFDAAVLRTHYVVRIFFVSIDWGWSDKCP